MMQRDEANKAFRKARYEYFLATGEHYFLYRRVENERFWERVLGGAYKGLDQTKVVSSTPSPTDTL